MILLSNNDIEKALKPADVIASTEAIYCEPAHYREFCRQRIAWQGREIEAVEGDIVRVAAREVPTGWFLDDVYP